MWYFAAGDAGFDFSEQLKQLSWLPIPWHSEFGFGFSALIRMWFDYPYQLFTKILFSVGLSWFVIDKILWISVFAFAIYSSFRLAQYVLKSSNVSFIASIVYATNTYILLLFSGGQIGVALAYGFAPWVLLKFIERIDETDVTIGKQIVNGLLLALLIAFDLRIACLVIGAIVLYWIFKAVDGKERVTGRRILYIGIIPILITGLIHSFWILPTLLAGGGAASLGEDLTNPGMLKFLSVADFSHAFSLLHPNWPENLFGKVYFLQPEFLVLPLIAFGALLFVEKKPTEVTRKISFFSLIALAGAFLAKGVNEPFGGVFQWMFIHVPGFILFRDPTKFYLFTALGYAILIPYTFEHLIKKHLSSVVQNSLLLMFVVYWCFTIRPVFMGTMRGNFQPLHLSSEYIRLKDMLLTDSKPSRTLWIPQKEAFAYISDVHPFLTGDQLFNNASISGVIALIQKPEFMKSLADSGVGYVIVPTDLEKHFFLTDYRFNPGERSQVIDALKKTSLKEDTDFTEVAVFKNTYFTMMSSIPSIVAKQQSLANIGVGISIITLISSAGILLVLKRRK